ncbi:transglycosylase domain-containing protein [Polaromonas aquatica]|uniref:transglycosylase domain-containing protein n=1 Tax=Polaromonas aquatica TaxID=332657 RepID=UPI003D66093F
MINHDMKIGQAIIRTMLWLSGAVALALVVAAGYYANEVRAARGATPSLVSEAGKRFGAQLKLTDLSKERQAILLAVEDPAFTRHHGVDLETSGAGMTTITQALVKLIYFPEGFKQGIAKIRQTLIAQYALDSLLSKNDQMQLFLNICYLGSKNGQPVHGYAAGAQAYFGKNFAELTDEEFLSLVAMHIAPDSLKPGTPENTQRVQRIHAYLSGKYQPASLLDVDYNGKQRGTLAEEALMSFLRLITDARPGHAGG